MHLQHFLNNLSDVEYKKLLYTCVLDICFSVRHKYKKLSEPLGGVLSRSRWKYKSGFFVADKMTFEEKLCELQKTILVSKTTMETLQRVKKDKDLPLVVHLAISNPFEHGKKKQYDKSCLSVDSYEELLVYLEKEFVELWERNVEDGCATAKEKYLRNAAIAKYIFNKSFGREERATLCLFSELPFALLQKTRMFLQKIMGKVWSEPRGEETLQNFGSTLRYRGFDGAMLKHSLWVQRLCYALTLQDFFQNFDFMIATYTSEEVACIVQKCILQIGPEKNSFRFFPKQVEKHKILKKHMAAITTVGHET